MKFIYDLSENTETIMSLVRASSSNDGNGAGHFRRKHGAHRVPDTRGWTLPFGVGVAVVVQRVPTIGTELEV